jgi:hypothetical protein
MKTPTWTRFGKGVIMMGKYPAVNTKVAEGEETPPPKQKKKTAPKD